MISAQDTGLDVTAAQLIRQWILDGNLPAGRHLIEAELAVQLGVSRGTVRVAFRQLEHEGLLEYRRHRGVFVAHFDAADALEVYTLRNLLEGFAARLAAKNVSDASRRALAGHLRRLKSAVVSGDHQKILDSDRAIHRAIVELSGHRRLQAAYQVIDMHTRLFMLLTEPAFPDLRTVISSHERLVAAIMAGDAGVAEALASVHN